MIPLAVTSDCLNAKPQCIEVQHPFGSLGDVGGSPHGLVDRRVRERGVLAAQVLFPCGIDAADQGQKVVDARVFFRIEANGGGGRVVFDVPMKSIGRMRDGCEGGSERGPSFCRGEDGPSFA